MPHFTNLYQARPDGAVLIRPDGLVAWRSEARSPASERGLCPVLERILDRGSGLARVQSLRSPTNTNCSSPERRAPACRSHRRSTELARHSNEQRTCQTTTLIDQRGITGFVLPAEDCNLAGK